jgi:carboxylesterase
VIVGRRHTARRGRLVGAQDGAAWSRDGREPCVVALHGFGGTTSELSPLLEALAREGYAVRAPLLAGHGTRPEDLQACTFDDWVASARVELEHARAQHGRVVLCGFSMGSLVAIELASEGPGACEGLVLLGNAVRLSSPLHETLGAVDRLGLRLPDAYFVKLWSADVADRAARARITAYDRHPLRGALEVRRGARRAEERLPHVTCPTLVLHGRRDHVCPVANVERVRARIGAKEVFTRVFADSAHLVASDHDHDAVAVEVLSFVRRFDGELQAPVEP